MGNFSATKIASSCCGKNCLCKRAFTLIKMELRTTTIPMQNSNSHNRIELRFKSIKDFGNFGRHFPSAKSAKILAPCTRVCRASAGAIFSKTGNFFPYHGDRPNTRNDARLWSPSSIMVPDHTHYLLGFPLKTTI